jgi:DMSO/TMAO reductase YedYZ molybdopterin-dependent catalytic subunit
VKRHSFVLSLVAILVFGVVTFAGRNEVARAQTAASQHLKIYGGVKTELELSAGDLKQYPRKSLKTVNPHSQKEESYEGVAVQELLHRAGVPEGENLRGAAMTTYVVAEASDGYRVVFSVGELDAGIGDSGAIVADTLDGAPLDNKRGPFQLVVPHDKRAARWVRMLTALKVADAGK